MQTYVPNLFYVHTGYSLAGFPVFQTNTFLNTVLACSNLLREIKYFGVSGKQHRKRTLKRLGRPHIKTKSLQELKVAAVFIGCPKIAQANPGSSITPMFQKISSLPKTESLFLMEQNSPKYGKIILVAPIILTNAFKLFKC